MMSTLSFRALLREALRVRQAADCEFTQSRLAELAGTTPSRVSEAVAENRGEPQRVTVVRLLRALGFELALVDVRDRQSRRKR
jgi:DNA-binding phage protein